MPILPRLSCAVLAASLVLSLNLLDGCSSGLNATPSANAISVAGNWQFSSSSPVASRLANISGSLSGTSAAITGTLHADGSTSCSASTTPIAINGNTSASGLTVLTGALAGGTLTISGTLAADGKSMSGSTYTVTGGTCAFSGSAPVAAQVYANVTGTYVGTLKDASGSGLALTANITQNTASDANGNFTVTGTGTFPQNPCILSPATVTNSQISGGSFSITYTDATTLNQVVATGSFAVDASSLTVSNYTLTGACADTGSGTLLKQ